MNIFKWVLVFGTILWVFGCAQREVSQNSLKQSPTASELVKKNAALAIKQCNKGNVKEVTVNGFSCKNGVFVNN